MGFSWAEGVICSSEVLRQGISHYSWSKKSAAYFPAFFLEVCRSPKSSTPKLPFPFPIVYHLQSSALKTTCSETSSKKKERMEQFLDKGCRIEGVSSSFFFFLFFFSWGRQGRSWSDPLRCFF